jgi:hypothetical protein
VLFDPPAILRRRRQFTLSGHFSVAKLPAERGPSPWGISPRHQMTIRWTSSAMPFDNDLSVEGSLFVTDCAGLYLPPGADMPKDE